MRPRDLDDAEVEQLHLAAIGQHDVAGRDVAVHEAEGSALRVAERVRIDERVEHLVRDEEHQPLLERPLDRVRRDAAGGGRDVASHHVLLGHEVLVADLAEVEHGHDVGVGQRRAELGLVDELVDRVPVARQLRAQPLDDEQPAKPLRAVQDGRVDVGHPSAIDPPQQAVAAEGQRLGGRRAGRAHLRGGAPLLLGLSGAASDVDGRVSMNGGLCRHRRRDGDAGPIVAAPDQQRRQGAERRQTEPEPRVVRVDDHRPRGGGERADR